MLIRTAPASARPVGQMNSGALLAQFALLIPAAAAVMRGGALSFPFLSLIPLFIFPFNETYYGDNICFEQSF